MYSIQTNRHYIFSITFVPFAESVKENGGLNVSCWWNIISQLAMGLLAGIFFFFITAAFGLIEIRVPIKLEHRKILYLNAIRLFFFPKSICDYLLLFTSRSRLINFLALTLRCRKPFFPLICNAKCPTFFSAYFLLSFHTFLCFRNHRSW